MKKTIDIKSLSPESFEWEEYSFIPLNDRLNNCNWVLQWSASDLCEADFSILREVSNVWEFPSDGLSLYMGPGLIRK